MAEAMQLDQDAFMRLVTEEKLQVEGPANGFLYTGKQGRAGWELYKTPNNVWWLWQATRVATQANAAGGAIVIDISLATGQVGKLVAMELANSGNNGLSCYLLDEDNNWQTKLGSVGAAAANILNFPSIGTSATATGNSCDSLQLMIGPGEKLSAIQSAAGLQNDTLTVVISLLLSSKVDPTWSKARSTNQANVTIADSTISAANTWQAVYLP